MRNVHEIMKASKRAADLTRQLLAFGRKQMQALQPPGPEPCTQRNQQDAAAA